jgi:hypothetical protein
MFFCAITYKQISESKLKCEIPKSIPYTVRRATRKPSAVLSTAPSTALRRPGLVAFTLLCEIGACGNGAVTRILSTLPRRQDGLDERSVTSSDKGELL